MAVPLLLSDAPPRLTGDLFERALTWRARAVWQRGLQASLVAVLAWLGTRDPLIWAWLAAAIVASAVDGRVSRFYLSAGRSGARLAAPTLAHAASATVFSVGALPLLASPSPLMTIGAIILLCAVCLNNAMMSYGSRLATAALVGPPATLLILTPFMAIALGHAWPVRDAALLSAGGLGFTIFIVRLAASLNAEGQGCKDTLQQLARQTACARAAEQAAEERRGRWELIFDKSPLACVVFDASRVHDLLHQRVRAHGGSLGGALKALYPTFDDLRAHIDGLDSNDASLDLSGGRYAFGEAFVDSFAAALDQMSAEGALPPFTAALPRSDGSTTDLEAHIRLASIDGRPWSLCLATYLDVTEARRAAREERRAREAAEVANRAKGEFLAMMSHEIRTPLNGVLGMAQAMAAHALPRGQRARLEVICQSGAALLGIIDDVLDLGRLEEGTLELASLEFELADLLEWLRAAFGPAAASRGLAFELAIAPDARGVCRGDLARLRQLVGALVSNAVKFTHQGGVSVEIRRHAAGVTIEVADTGIGIAPDRIAALFEPFEQADSSSTRRYGGAGLGLALCRRLCAAMGGEIAVQSAPGVGSAFRATLPLWPASRPAGASDGLARLTAGGVRVLAAEDNPVNQAVLKALLESLRVDLTVVENGHEAVCAWLAGDFDIVLMDVRMPEMDGPTAAQRIRELEREFARPRTPIIAVTANAQPNQMDGYRQAGMDGMVAKPIEFSDLVYAMASALERSAAPAKALAQSPARRRASSPRR